ncbi:MAG: cell division protein ZapB [Deltaproteobacteria bacterium]|nr:cell division protein ZapB [Deltaproteobacteria bacterium]MBW1912551.1 cell division protein ZapB [Deltaproteobacteria bacterium]
MEQKTEMDHFGLLEEKVGSLIDRIASLQKEKESLAEILQVRDERIKEFSQEVEMLKAARDKARVRILSLLEKIGQLDI